MPPALTLSNPADQSNSVFMFFIRFSVIASLKKTGKMYIDSMYLFLAEVITCIYIYICLSFLCIFLFRSPNRNVVKLLFSLCMFSQSQTTTTVDITTFIESLVNTAWRISVFGQSLVSRARRLAMCNSFLVTTAWCISVSI